MGVRDEAHSAKFLMPLCASLALRLSGVPEISEGP